MEIYQLNFQEKNNEDGGNQNSLQVYLFYLLITRNTNLFLVQFHVDTNRICFLNLMKTPARIQFDNLARIVIV